METLIDRLILFKDKKSFRDGSHEYSYRQLTGLSRAVSIDLLKGREDLKGARIGLMANPGLDYLMGLFGIWQAGGIAVPICLSYPAELIQYYVEDAELEAVLCSPEYIERLAPMAETLDVILYNLALITNQGDTRDELPQIKGSEEALILYTSGTTSKPKGVVITHKNISSQITTLISAWEWTANDRIISFLPLHHIHGIINVVACALWSGAFIYFVPSFDAAVVCDLILREPVCVLMAVPTIYYKLLQYIDTMDPIQKIKLIEKFNGFRLMVSGSSALPINTLDKWKALTGHSLLERYGMTEIGMAISNPLNGERKPGSIGLPLPGVGVRLTDDTGNVLGESQMGEIQIKGDTVFTSYWRRPEATMEAFTPDGWFKTGDMAVVEGGYYRILGRSSVDIIKSGGYKISALEIEEVIRSHPGIKDCAVVGLASEEWGEKVAVALMANESSNVDTPALKQWMQNKLPSYRIPKEYLWAIELPRNAMGKVIKAEVKKLFER